MAPTRTSLQHLMIPQQLPKTATTFAALKVNDSQKQMRPIETKKAILPPKKSFDKLLFSTMKQPATKLSLKPIPEKKTQMA